MTANDSPEGSSLGWRVHPAAERPTTGILVLAAILVLSFLAGLWMGGPYWGAFAFVVLFLSLEAFFLPGSFELSEQGVVVKKPFSRAERPWEHFRRVVFDRAGVTLSPFARRSWLETYRALRLRYPTRAAAARRGPSGGETRAMGAAGDAQAEGVAVPAPEEIQAFILAQIDREKVAVVGLADGNAEGEDKGEGTDVRTDERGRAGDGSGGGR